MKTTTHFIHSFFFTSLRASALGLVLAAQLATSSFGTTYIWNGGASPNFNWNNANNWFGAGTPTNGDSLVFQGAAGLNSTNNITGLTLNQIQFRNGGFAVSGNSFTLTNSIIATNTSGANTISCLNITLATSDVLITVSNLTTLTIASHLLGSVGVVKTGAGTLAYLVPLAGPNSYSGTTAVNEGLLTLNLNNLNGAFGGPLVIGDGSGTSATVRNLINENIPNSIPITINRGGVLDLNNFAETVGNVTMQGGTISSGTATLTVNGNLTTLASTVQATINGNISFTGGLRTISVADGGAFYDLLVNANIYDNGNGLLFTNSVAGNSIVILGGSNTLTGPVILNNLEVSPITSYSLGATNPVTVGGAGTLWLYSSGYTNKTLTLQAGANLTAQYNNTWSGTIVLGGNVSIYGDTAGGGPSTLNLSGGIFGAGNIAVTADSSLWVLMLSGSAVNTFNGDLSFQTGTLQLSKNPGFDGAIPHNLFIGDATHSATNRFFNINQIANSSTVTLYNGSRMDLNNYFDGIGSLVMYGTSSVTMGTGSLDMFSPGTIIAPTGSSGTPTISGILDLAVNCVVVTTNNLIISAQIIDSGNLTKLGPNTLFLTASNSYTGQTFVQQGFLELQNNFALGSTNSGTTVSGGASVVLDSVGITNEPLTLNGFGFSGMGGYGSLDVETGISTWAGPITNSISSTLDSWNGGSQLHISGPISGPGGFDVFGSPPTGGTVYFEGGAANTYAGLTTVDTGGTLLLNKTLSNGAIPGNLVINTNGTVRLGANDQIADSADSLINGGGLFDFGVFYENINTLHGAGIVNFGVSGYITVGVNGGSSTFDGTFTGTGYAAGYTVGQSGGGIFTMTGNNTFTTGFYSVINGKMIANGSSPQVPVFVNPSGAFGGSGTVGTITAFGTISPGNSPGILSSSNVTFILGSSLNLDIYGPTAGKDYDQLNVTGTNTLSSATLNINLIPTNYPVSIGQTFTLINNDLADAFTGIFNAKPEGTVISQNGFKGTLSYVGGSGNDLTLTITSVPGAALSTAVTSGNGSHTIDPNECNSLNLVITNSGGVLMSGINATLSTTTPGVLITQPYSTYANIAAAGKGTNLAPFQISTLPSFVCGTTINLQLIVNATSGDFITSFTLNTGGVSGSPLRFDNNVSTGIPDIGTIDSTNVASGFSGPLEKVAVSLYLTHTFDSDLSLSLISPDGTTVPLASGLGGSGHDYGINAADTNRTTFDDAVATAITAGAPPFAGTFRPQGSLANFNFNGTPNGNWKLRVTDANGGSLGTLRNWSLFLYPVACTAGGGNCDYCLTSITNSITLADPTMTNRIARDLSSPPSCGAPKAFPGIAVGANFHNVHYDSYLFTNTSAADACVTVLLTASCDVQAGIYLNSYDPLNIATNYLGDSGNSTVTGPQSCSVSVPAGAMFAVVVNEIVTNTGCSSYTLQLSGLPCPPPVLAISKLPVPTNSVTVNWPTWAGGYQLEALTSLSKTNWAAVTNEPLVNLNRFNVTNTMNPTNTFYRLKKP